MSSRSAQDKGISVRQPVSCEPCRRRKIKCSRTKPPCDTCRRRGCVDSCVYKGLRHESQSINVTAPNEELLLRISNLESLLRRQTGALVPSPEEDASNELLSPPMEQHQDQYFQLSPENTSSISDVPSMDLIGNEDASPRALGLLRTSSNANVRYEARFAQWTSVLANTSLSLSPASLNSEDEASNQSSFSILSSKQASIDELLALLPPRQQCDYLKNKYFTVFSPLFHVLHDPTFNDEYDRFIDDPSTMPVSWLAILFVLISLAVTALEETDPILKDLARCPDACRNIRQLSKRYRDSALHCLSKQGVLWGNHNIQSLQALVLLLYAMSHSQENTWVLLGMTYNVAVALACHIDPDNFDLNPIQSEERRRCWAALMMQYTIQNTFLGNFDPWWQMNHDVKLPADANDMDITLSGIQRPIMGPSQMSYLLFKFRLYNLSARICREVFTSEPIPLTIQQLDHEICVVQESWDSRYLADSTFEALPVHHAVHLHILHAYSHQLFLLLHRPFFAKSVLGLDVPNDSQIRCIASAEALLDIHRTLSETADFRPYMWYTIGLGSFHAFHAAAVLAVTLLMPIYKPQYQKFKGLLDQTLARFEAAAGRSNICENSARVLRFLMATPSPNQSPSSKGLSNELLESEFMDHNWLGGDQMKLLAERLEPQQWLGPSSMGWTEWDNLMTHSNSIRV